MDITEYMYCELDNKIFSRDKDKRVARDNLINILTTSFMWVNPLEGQEYTRNKNMNDLIQKWMRYYYKAWIKSKISIDVTLHESGHYNKLLSKVRLILLTKHGYRYISPDFNIDYLDKLMRTLQRVITNLSMRKVKFIKDQYDQLDKELRLELELNKLHKVDVK